MSNAHLQPFAVGEVVLTSLEALVSAAALNLGDAMPNGQTLAKPDPQEAWYALLAASGLMNHVGPLMKAGPREKLESRLAELLERFSKLHGDREFPIPKHLLAAQG